MDAAPNSELLPPGYRLLLTNIRVHPCPSVVKTWLPPNHSGSRRGNGPQIFRETRRAAWHKHAVNRLTRREQLVLAGLLAMLLVGAAVKWYRTTHPPAASSAAGQR